mgnify:CR=1 FL=1|jgi:hypothetical protein
MKQKTNQREVNSTHTQRKLNLGRILLIMVLWVFISGVSYGQVTISTNTIWDNPTLLPL